MRKKKILILILITLIVLIILIGALFYFLWPRGGTGKGSKLGQLKNQEYRILYQKSRHAVNTQNMLGSECYSLNFVEFLDGSIVNRDGSNNKLLDLKNNPTSLITSKKYNNYFYISSPDNPASEVYGYPFFNWSLPEQTLWSADFKNNQTKEIKTSTEDRFPGGVLASPENRYLVYLMTTKKEKIVNPAEGFISDKINPFISDSNLIIKGIKNGQEKTVLTDNYNRQLFESMGEFSDDGEAFYTIIREGAGFKLIKILLDSGKVKNFSEEFLNFDSSKIPWEELFPEKGDFAYASFSIDPNEERLIIYKNKFGNTMINTCIADAKHKLWIFNLKGNSVEVFDNQEGYVSDLSWNKDGQGFALAIMTASGCYPDYMDAKIDKMDKNGKNRENLVTEKKSKITHIGWSPDGKEIAYDVYSTDMIGRIKKISVADKTIKEIINTQTTEKTIDKQKPVLLFFVDWVSN